MRWIREFIAQYECEIIIVICLVALAFITYATLNKVSRDSAKWDADKIIQHEARASALYSGWVKQTGNPKNLTMDEFFALQEFKLLEEKK
jgi:hypothetical protein